MLSYSEPKELILFLIENDKCSILHGGCKVMSRVMQKGERQHIAGFHDHLFWPSAPRKVVIECNLITVICIHARGTFHATLSSIYGYP